jgi:hypothetical protein
MFGHSVDRADITFPDEQNANIYRVTGRKDQEILRRKSVFDQLVN